MRTGGMRAEKRIGMPDIDWAKELVDQFDWHYANHALPRPDGVTDQEYFREPMPGWHARRLLLG